LVPHANVPGASAKLTFHKVGQITRLSVSGF